MKEGDAFYDGDVEYAPFITDDGRVGYRVTDFASPDSPVPETFIYFNPSNNNGSEVPNVFVYQGPHNDPNLDTPQHFYDVSWETAT